MSSYKSTAVRLLKCFCGCQELTAEEVQRIYLLNFHSTLRDSQAVKLFKSYLKEFRCGDKSVAEQYVEVFEQCGEYMKPHLSVFTLDELDELVRMGLPCDLEKKFHGQIITGDTGKISCLLSIQGELIIKMQEEYKAFQYELLKKLKKLRQSSLFCNQNPDK